MPPQSFPVNYSTLRCSTPLCFFRDHQTSNAPPPLKRLQWILPGNTTSPTLSPITSLCQFLLLRRHTPIPPALMTSMHPRLSVNALLRDHPPTLPVQPCLSVFLPEHYSINLGLQISKVFGFFTIVPAARLSHTTSASKLTSSLHLHRKTTMPCLPAKMTSSNPSIIQPPKASTPILTSPHPVSLDLRRLRARTSSLPKFKFTNSKEAR